MPTIFITDLDGTLLGHDDFGFRVIRDDILSFLERGVANIPNSSKTRREIEAFCDELGVTLPFVCENGASLVNATLLGADRGRLAPPDRRRNNRRASDEHLDSHGRTGSSEPL